MGSVVWRLIAKASHKDNFFDVINCRFYKKITTISLTFCFALHQIFGNTKNNATLNTLILPECRS